MNCNDIETFLELVRIRNITKVAANLYLSQSTVSNRLLKLENELGFQLFYRKRGHSQIELTGKGEEFIAIAQQWIALFEEAENIKASTFKRMRIVVNESTFYTLLTPFIRENEKRLSSFRFDIKFVIQNLFTTRLGAGFPI